MPKLSTNGVVLKHRTSDVPGLAASFADMRNESVEAHNGELGAHLDQTAARAGGERRGSDPRPRSRPPARHSSSTPAKQGIMSESD